MKGILKEPLTHFLVLGAALFIVYPWLPGESPGDAADIVVTLGQIEAMEIGFTRTWQRPPTKADLEGLIREYVREEICAREAAKMGLDRNDTIIRRRLRQKLEFITEDTALDEPADAELDAFLTSNPSLFRVDDRFTFRQIFLNPELRGDSLESDAALLLAQLREAGGDIDITALGDSLLLDQDHRDTFLSCYSNRPLDVFERGFDVPEGEMPAREIVVLNINN